MSTRGTPTTRSAERLATFWLDVEYTRIAPAFTAAGIGTILLKGPAFDQLLFDGRRLRAYADIDLLVDPASAVAAERLLEQLGFARAEREPVVRRRLRGLGIAVGVVGTAHATPWIRDRDQFTVDLHHTLPLIGATADEAWSALRPHSVTIEVVGAPVLTLDRAASALLIALHAAHHGPGWNRARTDLQRACEVFERDCWQAAARLARHLRADAAMGIGLGTTTEGGALARQLGLRTRPTASYRLMWSGVAWKERRRGRVPAANGARDGARAEPTRRDL
jgi:hypothetical protein